MGGLKRDCGNINLNKKLAVGFRGDIFGPRVAARSSNDTNNYQCWR